MTTNLLKSFNHILKGAHAMPVLALVQLIFYRCSYWSNEDVKQIILFNME